MTRREWIRRLLQGSALVLSAVVMVGLVVALRRDGPAALIAWREAQVRWSWIALSAVFGLTGHAIYVVGWRRLLTDYGVPISYWQAARFFLVSNLGRYLPGGKAWQMGIVGIMAAESGLPAAPVAATSLFQGLVGAAVGAILLLIMGSALLGIAAAWLLIPLAGIVALLALPAALRAAPRVRAALIHRFPGLDSVTSRTMWALVWTVGASWLAWGVALRALAAGLFPNPGVSVAAYTAAWIGPFLAGVIAFFAPAGLGVRDEVMRSMLTSAGLDATSAIILVVVARVWTTVIEVVPALAVLLVRLHSGRGARNSSVSSHVKDEAHT